MKINNKRKGPKELHYFRFVGAPLPDNPESSEVGGAYMSCWVNMADYPGALKRATESIEAEDWKIDSLDEWMICSEKYYKEERPDLEKEELDEILSSIKEAFEFGISKTFHCWNKDAPDANETYSE